MKRAELIRGMRESQLVYELAAVKHPCMNFPLGEEQLTYRIANYILDHRELFIGILNDEHVNPEDEAKLED